MHSKVITTALCRVPTGAMCVWPKSCLACLSKMTSAQVTASPAGNTHYIGNMSTMQINARNGQDGVEPADASNMSVVSYTVQP